MWAFSQGGRRACIVCNRWESQGCVCVCVRPARVCSSSVCQQVNSPSCSTSGHRPRSQNTPLCCLHIHSPFIRLIIYYLHLSMWSLTTDPCFFQGFFCFSRPLFHPCVIAFAYFFFFYQFILFFPSVSCFEPVVTGWAALISLSCLSVFTWFKDSDPTAVNLLNYLTVCSWLWFYKRNRNGQG